MHLRKLFYIVTHWEKWDYRVKYYPLAPVWLWYCLRARSMWWFMPSNPALTFGGFEGESKKEMYAQLPPHSFPRSIYIDHQLAFAEAEQLMITNGYAYPFAVKPDVGMMGLMFRKITDRETFKQYHESMICEYILQDYIDYPLEVSVFYYRYPGAHNGNITGFIKKECLQVQGDGTSTLWQLILKDERAKFRLQELQSKHEKSLTTIIPAGETFVLSSALNLSRGGKLIPLDHAKDEMLLKVFDEISFYKGNLFYGRYDIKCTSVEDLKEGKNFSILEYNGSGAEPHHVYGMGNNIFQAQKILLRHWKILFKISRRNHSRGVQRWKFKEGWEFLKKAKRHFKELRKVDRLVKM